MATYREIKGTEVGYESAAPGASADTGKIWYNTTDSALQSYLSSGAWASASPMINVGTQKNYGANGTQNAFWITNGGAPGVLTEEYNGTGWTSGGDIGTARPTQNGGFGTLTAGANFGGHPNLTSGDLYNGTTWTASPAALTNGRTDAAACGTQTAGLMIAGAGPPGTLTVVEEFSGTAWTAGGALPTAAQEASCAGLQTAAVFMGGSDGSQPTAKSTSFNYDGSSWTASGALPAAVRDAAGFGTQSAAVNVGGTQPSASTATNLYDGSAWSTGAAYPTAQALFAGGAGSGTAGTMAGGGTPAATTAANEYNFDANTYTLDAWATSTVLTTARSGQQMGQSIGTSSATFVLGGDVSPSAPTHTAAAEEWNGSAWTAGGSTPAPTYFGTAGGTLTAGWSSVGFASGAATSNTYEYDGSSWTAGGAASPGSPQRVYTSGSGPQTGAIMAGGWAPGKMTTTEEYDGTSWTAGGALTQGTWRNSVVGTSGAALGMGGYSGPPGDYAYSTFVGTYDGSSWTTSPMTMLYGGTAGAGVCGGSSSAGILGACYSSSPPTYARTNSQTWDGTSFATGASLNATLQSGSGAGDQTGALAIGGYSPTTATRSNLTEEYTLGTTTISAQDITTS